MTTDVRRIAWAFTGVLGGVSASSCSVPTTFACTDNKQCGVGLCIAGGCAFLSGDCPSGLRYGELSPEPLAGTCVEEGIAEVGSGDSESATFGTSTSSSVGSESGSGESGESESGDATTTLTTDTGTDTTDTTDEGTTTGDIPDTVIAHYSFDELDAAVIFDSSGNEFHAAMDNAQTTAPGVVDEGLSFANLDRVIVPLDVLTGRTEFTIEFYMRVTQPAMLRQFLFYYGDEFDTASLPVLTFYVEYAAAPTQTSRLVWTDANNQSTGLIGSTGLRGGGWHHVAMTFDAAQGMRSYVDHFVEDEDPLVPALLSPNLEWIQIGGVPTGFGSFTGVIDELRFSEGALTPAQMQPVP